MEEREEERCDRKRGKKGPQRVSFLVKDCASVSVPGLPLGFAHLCFYSEGNWPSRKLPPGAKRLLFLEKGQVNFPLWTPTHFRAMLSPPPPMLFVFFFSLLIQDSEGIGRVVSERSEILKKKLTICHSFEKKKKGVVLVGFLTSTSLSSSTYLWNAYWVQMMCQENYCTSYSVRHIYQDIRFSLWCYVVSSRSTIFWRRKLRLTQSNVPKASDGNSIPSRTF